MEHGIGIGIDPAAALRQLGVADIVAVAPLSGGWGGTQLWRVTRSSEPSELLLRAFPNGRPELAEREAIAQRLARSAGIPVPAVIGWGTIGAHGEHAALVMEWSRGQPAVHHLGQDPSRAFETGREMGRVLARIHAIPAPTDPAFPPAGAWIDWAGDYAGDLRLWLEAAIPGDAASRLLHLDFHIANVLIEGGSVSAVLDWANTRPGPPIADLARACAIVDQTAEVPGLTQEQREALPALKRGLMEGHADVFGPPLEMALFAAWALAAMVTDLAPKVGQPGVWLTADGLARLRASCERSIAAL